MSWDFQTEPEFQRELDWVDTFVRDEAEPVDFLKEHKATDGLFPTMHLPKLRAQAHERYDDMLYAVTTGNG